MSEPRNPTETELLIKRLESLKEEVNPIGTAARLEIAKMNEKSAREMCDLLRDQLRMEERRAEKHKAINYLLCVVIVILLYSVLQINGCVPHGDSASAELPY